MFRCWRERCRDPPSPAAGRRAVAQQATASRSPGLLDALGGAPSPRGHALPPVEQQAAFSPVGGGAVARSRGQRVIVKRGKSYGVSVYDSSLRRKRWVGTYPTLREAREAER